MTMTSLIINPLAGSNVHFSAVVIGFIVQLVTLAGHRTTK